MTSPYAELVFPPVIPVPTPGRSRTLVLCFDGTGDQFDNDNSNIIQLFGMLHKSDRSQQMVYYQAGIGTYTSPNVVSPFGVAIAKTLDMGIALYLDQHVMDGYEFLMQNYTTGDKICIFGFSRGAYTARALAGMVHKVGLLPPWNRQQIPFAWTMYKQADPDGWEQSVQFKKTFSVDVDIEFIGVWDTVESVGIIPKRLPFTSSNYAVRTFRHALSLDEHRAKFKANNWNRPTEVEAHLGTQPADRVPLLRRQVRDDIPWEKPKSGKSSGHTTPEQQSKMLDAIRAAELAKPTDIKEVWFAGAHCDVGGGSVENGTPHSLARIPLRWMIQECFRCNTGILFESDKIEDIGLPAESLWPTVVHPSTLQVTTPPPTATTFDTAKTLVGASSALKPLTNSNTTTNITNGAQSSPNPSPSPSQSPSSADSPLKGAATPTDYGSCALTARRGARKFNYAEIEHKDAISPIYDQLKLNWWWWILELLPLEQRYQDSDDDSWVRKWIINLGQPRHIPLQRKQGFMVHSSVKTRMEAIGYQPKTPWKVEPIWVD